MSRSHRYPGPSAHTTPGAHRTARTLLPRVLCLAVLGVAGCAAPAPKVEPMVGVLGSAEQARATPEPRETAAAAPAASAAPDTVTSAALSAREAAAVAAAADGRAGLRAAEDAYARGDWPAAVREFKALTAVYPRNGQVWFGLGAASALTGDLEEASNAFQTALSIEPRDARAAYNLSLIRMSQAEVALGIASAHRAQAAPPVQAEILRLSQELAPLFKRSAEATPAPAAPTAFRTQDPARRAAPSPVTGGMFSATPLIPPTAVGR